jgi:RimJ/RimL family protein N-acetyltransferase
VSTVRERPAPERPAAAGRAGAPPHVAEAEASPRPPILRGQKVWLRAPERADIPLFVAWLNDSRVLHFLAGRAPLSTAAEERWFDQMLERQGKDFYPLVICLLDSGRAIGTCALMEVDRDNGRAGFGIFIGEPRLWGRGYGTDALNAIVDFGFGELRLERIWLDCYTFNARGRRSYEKAGFKVEGTQRRAIFHRGQHHDVWTMAILRDEWAALDRPRSWDLAAEGAPTLPPAGPDARGPID